VHMIFTVATSIPSLVAMSCWKSRLEQRTDLALASRERVLLR